MVRLQIQLEPAQHREVKRRARRQGLSVSEVIRRCVAAELAAGSRDEPDQAARRLLAVAGKYEDRGPDHRVAAGHDAILTDAFRR